MSAMPMLGGGPMLDQVDQKLLDYLYDDLPDTEAPFEEAAREIGLSEPELFARLQQLMDDHVVRRVAACVAHRKIGICSNAVCAWRVPPERVDEVGRTMASVAQVSKCYERETTSDWPYNMYSVVHGYTDDECEAMVEEIRQAVGIDDFVIAYSVREFKKQSARI